MAKVLMVADTPNWAIGRLCRTIEKHNPHHKTKIIYIGPRDVKEKFAEFQKTVRSFKPDIIQYDYFRTGGQLIELDPLVVQIPSIVVHHNQRDKALYMYDFFKMGIKHMVVHNDRGAEMLATKGWKDNVHKIQLGIDVKAWNYKDTEPEEPVIGYVGRIVQWKKVGLVADATRELGVPLQVMGLINDVHYWDTVDKSNMRFDYWECKDEERKDFYNSLLIYVGASDDTRETGPLGLMEAMASGVPCVTTMSGIAKEIAVDGENCLVVPFDNKEMLKKAIKRLIGDQDLRQKLRKNAWNTVKNMTEERYAQKFSKLWYDIKGEGFALASVIIPTHNRADVLKKSLDYFGTEEDYPNFEVVVCDDNSTDNTEEVVKAAKEKYDYPIKYINTKTDGYNLALARNLGVSEAEGEILIFCDNRLKPEPGALLAFSEAVINAGKLTEGGNQKVWFFGDKGSQKQSFVENFSAVHRKDLIAFGMFNERIDKYGGMSQEIRSRWAKQGGEFYYLGGAKAVELASSGKSIERRHEIVDMKNLIYKLYGNERH